MKSNFKHIVFSIIFGLILVFIFQLFWLRSLYQTIQIETEKIVMQCMDMADSDELDWKTKYIHNMPEETRASGEISFSRGGVKAPVDADSLPAKELLISERTVKLEGDTVETKQEVEEGEFSMRNMETLVPMIKMAMHQTLDTIVPVRLDTLYSFLKHHFETKRIHSEIYNVSLIQLDTDSVLDAYNPMQPKGETALFTYPFDQDNHLGYRIETASLARTVLTQMSGILATTFIILIILAFAFWYLLRTIFRQKTLEEMKDDFTNNMTHELKTPIAVAYAAVDALLNYKQGDSKEKRDKYLTICLTQLERLTGLVEQILSSSMERRLNMILKKEKVSLQSLAESVIEQHRLKAKKDVAITLEIEPSDLTVWADKTHIGNALSNLIDNAIKYSGDSVAIEVRAYAKADSIVLSVKDNGIGIPADKQKYLFDKYYRVPQGNKHNAKGYGLGLFYVKTMIEKHGGTINLTSQPEKGSVFTIEIPVNE